MDASAVAAAIAHPEIVLKRPIGSSQPFAIDPVGLPNLPDAPTPSTERTGASPKAEPKRRRPADRSRLDAAEAALRELDEGRKVQEAEFKREQEELDNKKSAAQNAYVQARKRATAAVVEARAGYRKAGGAA